LQELVRCRQAIHRAAWRLQYRQRVIRNRESIEFQDYHTNRVNFVDSLLSENAFNYYLSNVSSEKGRVILLKIFKYNYKEKEIANELKMSQQGVNKWKKKCLKELLEMNRKLN
jgi:DNA-directed RNA polymerase specialized sigma subunit